MGEQKFELVVFDLDGTLIDSETDLANAVNFMRSVHRLPELALPKIRSYIGDGVHALIERSLPGFPEEEIKASVVKFRSYYKKHMLDSTVLYPGIKEMLDRFSGLKKAVLTNKLQGLSEEILEGLKVKKYFELVWGGDTGAKKKPDPDPLCRVIEQLNASPEKTVMIGDGVNDIKAAKAAGIASIAVGYGYTDRKTLLALDPDCFAPHPKDLLKLLK